MKKYIGILSVVYIIAIIVKLKDSTKSFKEHLAEYKELKDRLKLIGQKQNPFVMMKFLNSVFYFFLFMYYIAVLFFFEDFLVLDFFTYLLIIVSAYRLGRKLLINSLDDFEETVKYQKNNYHKKQKFDFLIGLIEFAYAFNALSLISFYY